MEIDASHICSERVKDSGQLRLHGGEQRIVERNYFFENSDEFIVQELRNVIGNWCSPGD